MKNSFFLLLTSVLLTGNVVAQSNTKNTIKVGVMYQTMRPHPFAGFSHYNEYNRRINKLLTVSPSLHVGYASGGYWTQYIRQTKAMFSTDLNLFLSPVRFDKSRIRVGIGPSLRFHSSSEAGSYSITRNGGQYNLPVDKFPYFISPIVYRRPQHYVALGYSAVVEGELNVAARWLVGVRASYQRYRVQDIAVPIVDPVSWLSLGLNAGYRF